LKARPQCRTTKGKMVHRRFPGMAGGCLSAVPASRACGAGASPWAAKRVRVARGDRASSRSLHWRADPSRGAALPARRDLRTRSPSRAHFSVFSPAKRGTLPSGAGGGSCFATSGAARSAGAQGCRAKRGRGARAGAVRPAGSTGLLRRRPRAEALGAEHRSAVARRPQAVADRGRRSETGTPTRPATRGLRAPAARQALRHSAELRLWRDRLPRGSAKSPENAAPDGGGLGGYLNRSLTRSVQVLELGECLSPPLRSDSSSSLSSLRWCSVSLIGVSSVIWQYRSPG
jgi:hypothetical protein